MPYNSLIDRTAASALIPTEYATDIVKATVQESAALQLCRRATMGSGQQRMPVLSTLPEAFWVNGDTGLKETTSAAWQGIYLNAEEVASITPIPESVLDDASFDVWAELREPIAGSIAQKLDAAVLSGIEKPASWPEALIPAATAAGNAIAADSTPAEGAVLGDLADLLGLVESDGFNPTGFSASRSLRPLLRAARSTTGESLAGSGDAFTLDSAWATPIVYAVAGSMANSIALAGDFSCAVIGVRQDLTWKVLDQATIVDDTGKVILALAQQDSVALRVVARFAFAVGVPATLSDTVSGTAYPFAVLNPGTTLAAKSGSKKSA